MDRDLVKSVKTISVFTDLELPRFSLTEGWSDGGGSPTIHHRPRPVEISENNTFFADLELPRFSLTEGWSDGGGPPNI